MSKREHHVAIAQEIQRINEVIDYKIVRGLSYRAESKRHSELVRQLQRNRAQSPFGKALSLLAGF